VTEFSYMGLLYLYASDEEGEILGVFDTDGEYVIADDDFLDDLYCAAKFQEDKSNE